jgi:hypothetical protein
LQKYSDIADELESPTIVWGARSIVFYVNEAYKKMTGFNLKLPSDPDRFLLMEMLSIEVLRSWRDSVFNKTETTVTSSIDVSHVIVVDVILSHFSFFDKILSVIQ